MQTRQWMITHKWMVNPTPQREWSERRGIMVWIAETFTSLGAGLFLVSLFMNSWWGMVAGWLIIMFLKLPIHLAYFGKPLRFYKTIPPFSNAWKTSWFARGILFTILFSGFAFVQLVFGQSYIAGLVGPAATPLYYIFGVLAGIFAFMTGIYGGFIMNYCKSIPFWNLGSLPIIFLLTGVTDGFALIMGVDLAGSGSFIAAAEFWSRIILVIDILLIAFYLINANRSSVIAQYSAREMISGPVAAAFWVGVIALFIFIPLVIAISSIFAGGSSTILLIIAIASDTIGAFFLKYCLLKVGVYRPLLDNQHLIANNRPT